MLVASDRCRRNCARSLDMTCGPRRCTPSARTNSMTRRKLLSSAFLGGVTNRLAISAASKTQPPYPGTRFHHYSRCLPDYLRGLAAKAVERRNAELAKLVSPPAIQARQTWVRETLWKPIGGMPERTPLNPRA